METIHFILDCSDVTQNDEWTIEKIMVERSPFGWIELFRSENIKAAAKTIQRVINEKHGGVYIPLKRDLFQAYHFTPLNTVKVCIIAQDPYPGMYKDGIPHANGLCLSNSKGRPIQPSLKNVFIEIKRSDPNFVVPNHGDLTGWAFQGCLLLNACMTTSPGVVGAHGKIWKGIVKTTLELIRLKRPDTAVLLLGREAQDLEKVCGSLKVFKCSHPSNHSFDKGEDCMFGSNIFLQINEYLISKNISPIDWSYLP